MRRMVEKILCYYGRKLTVHTSAGEVTVRGFLQPVRGKGRNMTQITMSPLGAEASGQWVYIGPAEPELSPGDTLELEGKQYLLRKTHLIDGTNGPAYRWGMCTQKGDVDVWG